MAKGRVKRGKRHRLEVHFRIGQRMRIGPFLMALLGAALLGLMWAAERHLFGIPEGLIRTERREYAIALIAVSVALYVANIFISRVSMVQARADHLFVRAGLLAVVFAYERIRSLRSVRVGDQYSPRSLREGEQDLMEPFFGATAIAVDLNSFPLDKRLLRLIWTKFMFTADREGLMLVVKDPLNTMQEIDSYRQRYLDWRSGRTQETLDVFERAASRRRR